jgi:hypothetical protein
MSVEQLKDSSFIITTALCPDTLSDKIIRAWFSSCIDDYKYSEWSWIASILEDSSINNSKARYNSCFGTEKS